MKSTESDQKCKAVIEAIAAALRALGHKVVVAPRERSDSSDYVIKEIDGVTGRFVYSGLIRCHKAHYESHYSLDIVGYKKDGKDMTLRSLICQFDIPKISARIHDYVMAESAAIKKRYDERTIKFTRQSEIEQIAKELEISLPKRTEYGPDGPLTELPLFELRDFRLDEAYAFELNLRTTEQVRKFLQFIKTIDEPAPTSIPAPPQNVVHLKRPNA